MNKRRIGVITLAITFISIGILLLMRNFIGINLKETFSIAWPSIIILFGLEIIITKIIIFKQHDEVRTHIDAISVILLSIIIVITSIYSSFSLDNRLGFFSFAKHFNARNFSISSPKYTQKSNYSYNFNFEADDKKQLEIINSFGDIEIRAGEGEHIEIIAEVDISHNDEEYAEKLSKNIIQTEDIGGSIKVVTNLDSQYEKEKAGNIRVNYSVYMPEHIKVNVENKFGNITVSDIKNDVEIYNQHGNIKVTDITGKTKANNSFGQINISNISGDVSIECAHGNIEVENVSSSIDIVNSFGWIKVFRIKGEVNIDNQHNNVYVDNTGSNVKIKNKFGDVDAKNINGDLNIENGNGNINIESIKGNVVSYDKFGNIDVKEANKFVKIILKNGNISFKTDKIIEEGIEIENEFGDINIWIPSEQKGRFNILAEFGVIKNKLGLSVNESITEQSINDFIGSDDVVFYIRGRNGNINVNSN